MNEKKNKSKHPCFHTNSLSRATRNWNQWKQITEEEARVVYDMTLKK